MKRSLKHSVQQHLDKKSLSSRQLNQLLIMQTQDTKPNSKPYFSAYKIPAIASVLILSIGLNFYFTNTAYFSTQSIEQRIATEVAGNHLKLKPLEVSVNTIQDITDYFKLLDFSPISPALHPLSKQSLLGGRYCSIQGVTALQLRVINNETHKVQSLYETQYDKQVFKNFPNLAKGSPPLSIYVKGVKVEMWVEKDLLFALIE